jgi:hypothetical protein
MSAIIEFIAVAVIGKVLVPAGAKLIRQAITGGSELPHDAAGSLQNDPSLVPLKHVPGIKNLRSRMASAASGPSRDLAVIKQGMLETIASTSLYAADSEQLGSRIEALRNAATIGDVKAAGLALADAAIDGHHQLVTSGLQTAIRNAAAKIGFGKIEPLNSPLGSDIIRLAATDASGRSIVTEIEARPERDLKIAAEVVGVTDNACHQILDEFYSLLKEEGIEMSKPPRRKPTGGICELAATKAFLAKKLNPIRTRSAMPTDVEVSDDDRRVRMNRPGRSQSKAKLSR